MRFGPAAYTARCWLAEKMRAVVLSSNGAIFAVDRDMRSIESPATW